MMRLRLAWWIIYTIAFVVWYVISRDSIMLLPIAVGVVMTPVTFTHRKMLIRDARKKRKSREIK